MSLESIQKSVRPESTEFLRPKIWLSWSSGKDSYAALQQVRFENQYHVESIFTVVDPAKNQIPMHAVSVDLLRHQAKALGLQYHLYDLDDSNHNYGIHNLLNQARQSNVRFFAFGDLFLEDIKQYREQNMANTGIGTLFPLWQQPTEKLVLNLIRSGMRAIITSVDLKALPASFLGRELTNELVEQLIAMGCDPCGENGEYHSFVFDGPLFHHPVPFVIEELVTNQDFGHLSLRPAEDKSIGSRRNRNLTNDGFEVLKPGESDLRSILLEISSIIVEMANETFKYRTDERRFSNLAALSEGLATGLSESDPVCQMIIDRILQAGHTEIGQIKEEVLPIILRLAQELGCATSPDRAIIRFRIAIPTHSNHDHLWHQDSVEPTGAAKNQRATQLGFWIPLHDVGINDGTMEFATGSHSQPIPHSNKDPWGRLYFLEKYIQANEKTTIPVPLGDVLVFDSWTAHRTAPNSSNKIRLALLVWF